MAKATGFIDLTLDEDDDAPGPSSRAKRPRSESPDDDVCIIVHPVKRTVQATCAELGDGEELQIVGDSGGQASHFKGLPLLQHVLPSLVWLTL